MPVRENRRFLNGLLLGATLSASVMAVFVAFGFWNDAKPQDREKNRKEPEVYAQEPKGLLTVDYQPYQANVGKSVYINGSRYLIVQELRNTVSGYTARILAAYTDENIEYVQLAVESGSVYQLQCLNGQQWFGNRVENSGGETILTIWDQDGERLVDYNHLVMRKLNAYSGCLRPRIWFGDLLVFEILDLRHAQLQAQYYGYDAQNGGLDLIYAYESYATNQDRLNIWFDRTRQYGLIQFVSDSIITDLYRVPYLDIEGIVVDQQKLYSYPTALPTDQAIEINLLADEPLLAAERGIIVEFRETKTLVEWED